MEPCVLIDVFNLKWVHSSTDFFRNTFDVILGSDIHSHDLFFKENGVLLNAPQLTHELSNNTSDEGICFLSKLCKL